MSYKTVCDTIIDERKRLVDLISYYYAKASHSKVRISKKYIEKVRECKADVEKLDKLIRVIEEEC